MGVQFWMGDFFKDPKGIKVEEIPTNEVLNMSHFKKKVLIEKAFTDHPEHRVIWASHPMKSGVVAEKDRFGTIIFKA